MSCDDSQAKLLAPLTKPLKGSECPGPFARASLAKLSSLAMRDNSNSEKKAKFSG
ncbi:MAG: hypothetical protein ACI945_001438 [Pseudohongiellaceae bacterium]|jgi:hypothetical protein